MVPSIEEYSQGSVPTGLSNFIGFNEFKFSLVGTELETAPEVLPMALAVGHGCMVEVCLMQ